MTQANVQPNVTILNALKAAGLAGLIAAAINFIVYYAARLMIGGPLLVDPPGPAPLGSLPISAVVVFSIVPALGAGIVFWALDRFLADPRRVFLIIAAVIFILFIYPPLPATTSAATAWTLQILHGVVAVPVVMALLNLKA